MRSSVTLDGNGTVQITLSAESGAEQLILALLKGRDCSSLIEVWHDGHEGNGRIKKATITFMQLGSP